jgi:spore germination protein GerM
MTASGWRRIAAAALVALGVAVGCGIDAEREANRVPPTEVPFGLLDQQATTSTEAPSGRTATVYLVAEERLVDIDRPVADGAGLSDLLELVVDGPSDTERVLGVTTAIPEGAVAAVSSSRGLAEVDLTAEFGEIRSADQLLALAQIVYTLTAQPGIGGVNFTLEGEDVDVPLGDGAVGTEALTREDLRSLAPG